MWAWLVDGLASRLRAARQRYPAHAGALRLNLRHFG